MNHKTMSYVFLLGAVFIAIAACAGNSGVNNAPPARSEVSGVPTSNNNGGSSSLGISGTAQDRTPEQMKKWEKTIHRPPAKKKFHLCPRKRITGKRKRLRTRKAEQLGEG
jgi:hypothetical protein